MTAADKTTLARFLDIVGDYANGGHRRNRDQGLGTGDQEESNEQREISNEQLAISNEQEANSIEESVENSEPEAGADHSSFLIPNSSPSPVPSPLPLAYTVDEEEGEDSLETVAAEIASCGACGLAAARKNAVPGEGAASPLVMVIGEGPGADEDAAGRPFVGRAGLLLDKMLASIGLYRDKNCFIANMVKCRPPGNRDPQPDEIAACFPYLERQIALLRPRMILCAGRVAAQNLLRTNRGINALRGEFAEYRPGTPGEEGAAVFKETAGLEETTGSLEPAIPVLCTYHPSAILRDEALKRPAWEDLKLLRSRLASVSPDQDTGEGAEEFSTGTL